MFPFFQPYTGIADLFILDPDGYIIRKWNSKELNVGVLSGRFTLPEYPKVGFWKVRVEAQGQVNEMAIKVEKYYEPKFEVYVRMPTFILDTDKYIEADVSAFYPFEKKVRGDIHLRWFVKKVDYTTPLYNDSVLYREEYGYYHNISNTYRSNLYNTRDGIPIRNISLISNPSRYGYLDPYIVSDLFCSSAGHAIAELSAQSVSKTQFLRLFFFRITPLPQFDPSFKIGPTSNQT